jgi:UDP-hydrolysing UDP-N-acetyl-D-glucosamine 2-epimerase
VRKILFVTGSRGEYGYIRPLLKRMGAHRGLSPYVVATNMHLLPEFGSSLKEFQKDEIQVDERLLMSLAGYTRESMAKSLGILLSSLVDVFMRVKPQFVLLAGDRGEQLAAAIAASYMYIPVAHIQAGEVSGNIDGMARHAITKFSHIHFSSNADASERLRRMGEEEFRIKEVGAPQLDDIAVKSSPADVRARYHLPAKEPFLLVVQHPVTEEAHLSGEQMTATLEAVTRTGMHAVVIYPNNDAGSVGVQRALEGHRGDRFHVERNVSRNDFAALMSTASAMVGNSSAALLEAPTFALPAVNVGRRQIGRLRGANVIEAPHEAKAIEAALKRALSPKFRASLKGMANPYGDGKSSERILKILESAPLDEKLLVKRMTY